MANPIIRTVKSNSSAETTQPVMQAYSFKDTPAASVDVPPAGVSVLFRDASDGNLKLKDENGDVFDFGGGASGSSESSFIDNQCINGSFEFYDYYKRYFPGVTNKSTNATAGVMSFLDNVFIESAAGTIDLSHQDFTAGQTDVSGNPKKFVRATVSGTSNIISQKSVITFPFEDVAKYSGEYVTIGVDIKGDSTREIGFEFAQHFGSGGSASASVYGAVSQKITISNTWARYYVTLLVPSVSGKTIDNTVANGNADYLELYIWLSAGSNYDSRSGGIAVGDGVFDIANLDVKITDSITPFTYAGGSRYTAEKLMKRYIENTDVVRNSGRSGLYNGGALFHYVFETPKRMTAHTSICFSPTNSNTWTVNAITNAGSTTGLAASSNPTKTEKDVVFLYNGSNTTTIRIEFKTEIISHCFLRSIT